MTAMTKPTNENQKTEPPELDLNEFYGGTAGTWHSGGGYNRLLDGSRILHPGGGILIGYEIFTDRIDCEDQLAYIENNIFSADKNAKLMAAAPDLLRLARWQEKEIKRLKKELSEMSTSIDQRMLISIGDKLLVTPEFVHYAYSKSDNRDRNVILDRFTVGREVEIESYDPVTNTFDVLHRIRGPVYSPYKGVVATEHIFVISDVPSDLVRDIRQAFLNRRTDKGHD